MKKASFLEQKSISGILRASYIFMLCLFVIPVFYTFISFMVTSSRYDRIITNIGRASRVNQVVKSEVASELWNVIAGNKAFKDGSQYQILSRVENEIMDINAHADPTRGVNYLEVAARAMHTLKNYVDRLGDQIESGAPVAENEALLDEIRAVSQVASEVLQDFINAEIAQADEVNRDIKRYYAILTGILVAIILAFVAAFARTLKSVPESISRPIRDMELLSSEIASGDFSARVQVPRIEELDTLAANLNVMAERLEGLIQENIREQQNLKKAEMKTLQAQITPHFLYNTFDSIIWLAESGDTARVIEITRAFSEFFRISLSRGKDWITAEQELAHIRHYLTIQKIRYSDIMDYSVEADADVATCMVLKLTLQPLVENAIYHGIKNKRGMGHIKVTAQIEGRQDINLQDEGDAGRNERRVRFCIEDNGIGFTKEKLKDVRDELFANKSADELSAVYGLYNVNTRLKLYYGEAVSLNIESEFGRGTRVWFCVPFIAS